MTPGRRRFIVVAVLLLTAALGVTFGQVQMGAARRARVQQALWQAVGRGDVAAAEAALRRGADPNVMPSDGQVMWGSLDKQTFIDPRAWPLLVQLARSRRLRSYPPLYFAAEPGMVRALVAHGADPDGTGGPDFRTPLMQAAWRGRPAVARALLASGADVNRRSRSGFTALHCATSDLKYGVLPGAEGPYVQVVRALLQGGADARARTPRGMTALAFAQRSPHRKIERILRGAEAAP